MTTFSKNKAWKPTDCISDLYGARSYDDAIWHESVPARLIGQQATERTLFLITSKFSRILASCLFLNL